MRKLHFRYFWDGCNKHAIVTSVRNNQTTRHRMDGLTESSRIYHSEWVRYSLNKGMGVFPITRAQFRLFKKTHEVPEFSYFNKQPTA